MLKKKLTFMLIPNSRGILKQISIPVALIYGVLGGAGILLLVSFFLSAEFFSGKVDQAELDRLRTENKELHEKFEQLRWNLSEVENRYARLVDKEVKIRTIFDLPDVAEEERQLGVGGPPPPRVLEMTPTEHAAFITETEVDRLLRLSEFELEKYEEVETELVKLRDRLDHTPSIWPTKGWTSRGFGMKYDPFTGYKQMHRGLDVANHTGTPIIASAKGVVKQTGTSAGMGKFVVIDHGYGFKTRYAHLSKIKVNRGQKVNRGDIVALMGSTGYSTGPHLHYEVIRNGKFLDPMDYILNDQQDL